MPIKKMIMLLSTFFPSSLRVVIYRMLGAKIEKNVKLAPFVVLVADDIMIGRDSRIEPMTLIFNVKKFYMGKRSSVRFGSMVYGHGAGSFSMGDFSTLGLFTMVNCTGNFSAGNYFGTGPRCIIYTHGNFFPTLHGYMNQIKDVQMGNYVWLHMNVIVLPGVTIGDHVMVYSQAVVNKNLPTDTTLAPLYNEQMRISTKKLRKNVTNEYELNWYHNVWNELNEYIQNLYEDGSVKTSKDYFEVTIKNRNIYLYDGLKAGGIKVGNVKNNKLLIYFLNGNVDIYHMYKNLNWIDFKNNVYHFPDYNLLFKDVMSYLELYKAQYFYEYEYVH